MRSHNTSVNAKNQVSMLNGMGSRRRTKNQKIKKRRFFPQNSFFSFFKKFVCLHFQLKTTCKKSDSYLLWVFHNRLFNYWKKSKKAHNSVKKQNFKKRKKTILRSHNTSVHAKNQVSWFNGMGSRRRTKIKK